ncbi:single-stranded DNA-binding protein [Streptococcus dysgalactiae]|uniref:Single-stranded DNA-binding protein n=1 Tax=Streptococcus dysgalactiae subsp. equisimilis TaxID=119602 RepID=A0AAE9U304_STREQ|nr:single-stranded DNA-binding protein [Streptococcus dysgalactiae]HER4816149.1 single-stranded DNA-binding protein [Streptococcus pyogenes NGAS025]OBY96723.1 single-stranded DNA-binding protein [Streptococcus dysgalactiae subsp. equisimilis]SQB82526.1 ssDNA-binding protein [Streptococcus dysgalactiae]VTT17723.1 ssDNA-binding protein [Streptococcus dysgalactiae]VTT27481.1 ssDNA-binding protein [Streptococcus dysgalactiae subsp. equisimilis]
MINNVVLVGRLTKDADLRYTPSNAAVATFTLAVNRSYKNDAGEREADFINCVIWRQSAENLANWAKKGSLIGITGTMQTRNYENQQGQRVYVTEVIASNFQLLENRSSQQNQHNDYQNQGNGFQNGNSSNNSNFQNGNNQGGYQSPFDSQSQQGSFYQGQTTNPMDISDDDLPF